GRPEGSSTILGVQAGISAVKPPENPPATGVILFPSSAIKRIAAIVGATPCGRSLRQASAARPRMVALQGLATAGGLVSVLRFGGKDNRAEPVCRGRRFPMPPRDSTRARSARAIAVGLGAGEAVVVDAIEIEARRAVAISDAHRAVVGA